jgi:hypothetical protein
MNNSFNQDYYRKKSLKYYTKYIQLKNFLNINNQQNQLLNKKSTKNIFSNGEKDNSKSKTDIKEEILSYDIVFK